MATIKRISVNVQPNVKTAPRSKFMQPIGGLCDVPTGTYKLGPDGQYVCRGGVGPMMGFVGSPNSYKTTIGDWCKATAAARVHTCVDTSIWDYDTEGTAQMDRKLDLMRNIPEWNGINLETEGIYKLTDKTIMYTGEWFAAFKEICANKRKIRRAIMVDSPYWNARRTEPLKVMLPTFYGFDSISSSETEDDAKMQDKIELNDAKGRTFFMNAGLPRSRMLAALSTLTVANNTWITITGHVGDMGPQIGGNPNLPPPKKMHTMRSGEKLKGVTDNFIYLMTICWQMFTVKLLNNSSSDRTSKYPADSVDGAKQNGDLLIVNMGILRSKTGASLLRIDMIVSQSAGVLPELTEYHYIKYTCKDWGIEDGRARFHTCSLLPAVKFSRTTIRTKLKDPILARAINICSEMHQIFFYNKHHDNTMVCTPEDLYRSLIELGYDWDKILKSRGWHTVHNGANPVATLTTYSMLCIRTKELCFPEYMTEEGLKAHKAS